MGHRWNPGTGKAYSRLPRARLGVAQPAGFKKSAEAGRSLLLGPEGITGAHQSGIALAGNINPAAAGLELELVDHRAVRSARSLSDNAVDADSSFVRAATRARD